MSDFKLAYKKMILAEYSDREDLFVHHHNDESGYTVGGIYQSMNKNAIDWNFVNEIVLLCGDGKKTSQGIRRASKMIYNDDLIQFQVFNYFKANYWDMIRLDELHSDKVAQEIYMAAVLYGTTRSVKMAQKLAMVKEDGLIGDITLKALNRLDVDYFDRAFDEEEIKLATSIATNNNKMHYLKGWLNRANDSWNV